MTTLATTPRERALNSVFTTALEGGIGYWSQCTEYRWSDGAPHYNELRDFRAVIVDVEDEDQPAYVIDRAVIAKGIRLLAQHMNSLENPNEYQKRAANDLNRGRYDDADYDSITADMVVQFGLFEKLVYN